MRSESQATLGWCRQLPQPSCPRRAPSPGQPVKQLNLEIARRAETAEQRERERESNHWRESREGWHNEGWPLGRAETGLHRQRGRGSHNGNTERDGHRVTETPPGARDGELLVTEHRLLESRADSSGHGTIMARHFLDTRDTWSRSCLGASRDYFEMSEFWRQQSWYFQHLMTSMKNKNIGD